MCGIYGINSSIIPSESITEMGDIISHRGPDDEGRFIGDGIALGHKRLSIIDLSKAGKQPMKTVNGRYRIVFNGEIYNFKSLRSDLENRGYTFSTRTDTEVLLKGYEEWGEDVLVKLYGMFALAIWDCKEEELFLARDATGIKPLFYIQQSDYFVAFASEIKTFKALPGFQFQADIRYVHQYLEFGYVWEENHTLLKGISKLPPGSLIKVKKGRIISKKRWWRPPAPEGKDRFPHAEDLDAASGALLPLIETVVKEHLVADVPVGLLLSGGLDSSFLAAVAAKQLDNRLRTISIGFRNCRDEREYGRRVAEYIGSDHRELILDPDQVLREFKKSIWYYDDLFWDTGFITSLIVYRYCRMEGLRVVLVGEGADEVFGGYRNFQLLGNSWVNRLPKLVHRYLFYRQYSSQWYGKHTGKLMSIIKSLYAHNRSNWFSTVRNYELSYQIPNNLNMKVDRASMANSIEARVPFQDRRIMEYACRLSSKYFLDKGTSKLPLRHLAEKHKLLPEEIFRRPKLGFMMPGSWLTEDREFFNFAQQLVCSDSGWAAELGFKKQMEHFFAGKNGSAMRFFRQHIVYSALAWRLFVLELWCQEYL